ncbi:MAG TPA: hypothetical protein VNF07_08150 [Acidimicrobiales bacterium]|nr:hypothetical protein [Acidimicrobiales bacterium]
MNPLILEQLARQASRARAEAPVVSLRAERLPARRDGRPAREVGRHLGWRLGELFIVAGNRLTRDEPCGGERALRGPSPAHS